MRSPNHSDRIDYKIAPCQQQTRPWSHTKKKNKVALSLDKEIIDLSRAINGLRNAAWKRNERTTSSQNSSFLLFKRPY